jgi:hypothetical protein
VVCGKNGIRVYVPLREAKKSACMAWRVRVLTFVSV